MAEWLRRGLQIQGKWRKSAIVRIHFHGLFCAGYESSHASYELLIERFSSKLKPFRHEKLPVNFLAMVELALMRLWLQLMNL